MPHPRAHGPENAEFEIRKAYNVVIEAAVPYFWESRTVAGIDPHEALRLYKRAYDFYRRDNKLAAERWARAAKHLSRAFQAEAKIQYLEAHDTDLPFLEGGSEEAFGLPENQDTTTDLLNSVADHVPPGFKSLPADMSHYLARAREHLAAIKESASHQELLRAERIRAAYEYGRVLEIMALAFEAEQAVNTRKTA